MRRQWGQLMRYTNSARDWDTCINFARASLPTSAFESLYPAMAQRQEEARALALQAVRSADWEAHDSHWRGFLETVPDFSTADYETALASARAGVSAAWGQAHEKDERKSWHRLRIAIKSMRYILDTSPDTETEHEVLIELCKDLQTDLGDWHDTVVHRRLMNELLESCAGNNSIFEAADHLASIQVVRGTECLARVRSIMTTTDISQAK